MRDLCVSSVYLCFESKDGSTHRCSGSKPLARLQAPPGRGPVLAPVPPLPPALPPPLPDGGWGVAVAAAAAEQRHGQRQRQGAEEPPEPARRHRRSAPGEAGRAAGPFPGGPSIPGTLPSRGPFIPSFLPSFLTAGRPAAGSPPGPRRCPRCGVSPRVRAGLVGKGLCGRRRASPAGVHEPLCCVSALRSAPL